MKENLVTVCIPIYKPDYFYLKSLSDSLRNQTLKAFEVVISDDADDKSLVEELFYGINYKYFVNKGNSGIFFNLNNAISQSKSEYVQIICQDDILTDKMLEIQLATLQYYNQCGFIYTQCTKIDERDSIISKTKDNGIGFISKDEISNYLLAFGCLPGNLSTVMIKRDVLFEFGLFDTSQQYASDFNLWIKIASKYGMAINYNELLLLRCHPNQASFVLDNELATKDMIINLKILFNQSNISFTKKILHINNLYGKSILAKSINSYKTTKKISKFKKLLFLIYPLNLVLIIFFSFLYLIRIEIKINLGKFSSFPKPMKKAII